MAAEPGHRIQAVLARLSQCDRAASDRAARTIALALDGTKNSIWPEVAWRASTLTPTGFPLEFAWSSRDPSVRWTAEVTGPEVPPTQRLGQACTLLRTLGRDSTLPTSLADLAARSERFGAWLGGRHRGLRDQYKLYVELPADEGWKLVARTVPAEITRLVPRRVRWRMAGYRPENGVIELYGRIARHEFWELERLVVHSDLEPEPLRVLTNALIGARRSEIFPGTTGLSIALERDGTVSGVGWFALAQYLLGGGRTIRLLLREITDRFGWDSRIHEAILGGKEDRLRSPYGMVGAGVGSGGDFWLQIGSQP